MPATFVKHSCRDECYKWGFFGLDWNGTICTFSNILYISCWKREEEVHSSTNTREKLANVDWNGTFVLFSQHLVRFLLEKGRKRYTALQTLRKHERKKLANEDFWIGTVLSYYFPTSCTFLVGVGRGLHSYTNTSKRRGRSKQNEKVFGLERHLCTIFPTFPMCLVWKKVGKRYKHGIAQNSPVGKSCKTGNGKLGWSGTFP